MPTDPRQPMTLATPEAMSCPFDIYEEMRSASPAYLDAVTGFYVVTRYDDIKEVASDHARFSSSFDPTAFGAGVSEEVRRMYDDAGFPRQESVLVSLDPPEHRRQRTLVDKVFSPKRVRDAEPGIKAVIDELIDGFPSGVFDFCEQFAVPLPVRIIADQLGLSDKRLADFKRWSDASVDQVQQGRTREKIIQDTLSIIEMRQFFCGEIRAKRQQPDTSLLSALANSENEAGELMTEHEISLLLQLLLSAGNETTTHATGSAMYRLAQDAELQTRLRSEPSLIPTFIEEVLRLDTPLQGLFRTAREATTIGGVPVPKGSIVNIRFGAGNRDQSQYACAGEVDLSRGRSNHLAFGHGVHFCIGSQLARAELRLAFDGLLSRSKRIRLADVPEPLERIPHFVTYGPRRLLLEYEKA